MIIVIGGIKGGAGKSTIAANLAVRRAETCIKSELRQNFH
jgi:cellulose biosynthesis protein BcsQ